MKKLAILNIFLIALFFTSCDPNASIYEELDEKVVAEDAYYTYTIGKAMAEESYTLTDDDYELSSNEDVAKYKNFSEDALPKDFLPEILNQLFVAEDAFAMTVTYNYYSRPVVDEDNAYELENADYDVMGQPYGNFDNEDEAEVLIGKLLDQRTFDAEAGNERTVMYTLSSTYDTRYVQVNADHSTEEVDYDSDAYELTDADYDFLGEGYGNFYSIGDALSAMDDLAVENGDVLPQVYACTIYRSYYDEYLVYLYNGENWMVKQSVMAVSEPLNFSLNTEDVTLSTWWADPAIKISLGVEDYDVYPDECSYGNFDLRGGKVPGTDTAKLVEMLGAMLDANHNPVDDQQYLVTYAYYDGSNGFGTLRLIRTAGTWSEYSAE